MSRSPSVDLDLRQLLLLLCVDLDWSGISPAIFGAMFQGVLEQQHPTDTRAATRRELGAHYTSERHILRLLNPLCMDELHRSEEHTSELPSLMRTSYAVFCLKTKHLYNTR